MDDKHSVPDSELESVSGGMLISNGAVPAVTDALNNLVAMGENAGAVPQVSTMEINTGKLKKCACGGDFVPKNGQLLCNRCGRPLVSSAPKASFV